VYNAVRVEIKEGMQANAVTKKTKKKVKSARRAKKVATQKKVTQRAKPVRGKKSAPPKKAIRSGETTRRRTVQREISSGSERSSLGTGPFETVGRPAKRGLGQNAAGQSGDLQGLSRSIDVDSESVEELIEEGQSFEADAISGVENAPDPDQGEVRVHERTEDEFPIEEE
jgi:hypothetical protein